MQILRNRTQNNFTIISNEILRNRELSLKDRGLLCTLIGLPDSWKFSVKGLASIIIDGKDSIRTSLIKLEKLGYVNRYKERDLLGRFMTIIEVMPDNSPSGSNKGNLDDLELSYASSYMEESDETDESDFSDQSDAPTIASDSVKEVINTRYLCDENPSTTKPVPSASVRPCPPPPPPEGYRTAPFIGAPPLPPNHPMYQSRVQPVPPTNIPVAQASGAQPVPPASVPVAPPVPLAPPAHPMPPAPPLPPNAIHDGFTVTDNPSRVIRRGEAVTENPPQYNTYNKINTYNNINNKSIIHSINDTESNESTNDSDRTNDRSDDDPYEPINVRELIPFLTSTHRRVDYDKLKENLCEEEMEYVKKMVNLIVFCLAKKDTDHPVKIAGKYLGLEAIKHLLRYKYNELFAVAKNMYSANIPVNKPDSYYLTALDNQLRINNPAEYAAMESQEQ